MVEITYSSLTSIADNKHSFHYDSGKKEDAHVVNSIDNYNKIVENKCATRYNYIYSKKKRGGKEEYDKLINFINRKASKVSPREFDDWVQSQGGEHNFTSFVNLTTLPRRKRSFLPNASNSFESNRDQDTSPVTPTEGR